MNNAIILLGGNLGNIVQNFNKTIQLISASTGSIKQKSSLYQSKSWGFSVDELFLNQVIVLQTHLTAFELLDRTQEIEKKMGRTKKTIEGAYCSRLIDIDILFFNEAIIDSERLTVPHPKLHLRHFTLAPLTEILPNFVHPKLNKTMAWLLEHSEDQNTSLIFQDV